MQAHIYIVLLFIGFGVLYWSFYLDKEKYDKDSPGYVRKLIIGILKPVLMWFLIFGGVYWLLSQNPQVPTFEAQSDIDIFIVWITSSILLAHIFHT